MNEREIARVKWTGLPAILLIVILLGMRIASLGESDDPDLRAAMEAELRLRNFPAMTARLIERAKRGEIRSKEDTEPEEITIHSLRVSAPLLKIGASRERKVIVRVDYSIGAAPPKVEYHCFSWATLSGWRHRYLSSSASYYLNFL